MASTSAPVTGHITVPPASRTTHLGGWPATGVAGTESGGHFRGTVVGLTELSGVQMLGTTCSSWRALRQATGGRGRCRGLGVAVRAGRGLQPGLPAECQACCDGPPGRPPPGDLARSAGQQMSGKGWLGTGLGSCPGFRTAAGAAQQQPHKPSASRRPRLHCHFFCLGSPGVQRLLGLRSREGERERCAQ